MANRSTVGQVLDWMSANRGLILPIGLLASLAVLVLPMPTYIMDVFLTANISLSVLILLATVLVRSPMEFSVFPTVLLAATLFRLVLNVATTRLILVNAVDDGSLAAGHVVEAFGNFVAGGNLALGIVIFVILAIIQFIVINRGSVRTSEVAARFALDGMPGKQMAIDADLAAGMIDQTEARRRREEIVRQADFYGAMDGASKFVRGDSIATIIITIINIVGGLAVGVLYYGMPVAQAGQVFTLLTIGDGLASQLPAFLLSAAAGFLVTRQSSEIDLGKLVTSQVFMLSPQALSIASGFLGTLGATGFISGLPMVPLLAIAGACGYGAIRTRKGIRKKESDARQQQQVAQQAQPKAVENPEDALKLDAMELEVGAAVSSMVDSRRGESFDDAVVGVRQVLAQQLGLIFPKIRLRGTTNIDPNSYVIKIKGCVVATGMAYPGQHLAIDTGMTSGKIGGTPGVDPIYGEAGLWIDSANKDRAIMLGYSVFSALDVLTTHLTETIRKHAHELLTRDQVQKLVKGDKETPSIAATEALADLKLGEIHRVLQNLLKEQVSIRDMETILEALADGANRMKDQKDIDLLTEMVRVRLARTLSHQYRDPNGVLRVLMLDPNLENIIQTGLEPTDRTSIKLPRKIRDGIVKAVEEKLPALISIGAPTVVLVQNAVCRAPLKQLTLPTIPKLVVLKLNEVTRDTTIESVGVIEYMMNGAMAGAET